ILGHSLEGHVAYLYAARHPERVESLILVDVGPPLTEELARRLGSAMRAQRTADDDADLQRIGTSAAFEAREPKAMEDYILNIYAPFFRDRTTIPTVDLAFTQITAANVVDYEERLVATLPEQDPLDRLAEISCPTLVVHGEVDPIPLEFSRFLADQIPGAELAVIPGGSHFPFIEDRDAFLSVVRNFLAKPN
ncbi:MAG: alpha/beta fold hydrolase, partial [Candidatus Limnocylindria bacterium]